MLTAIRNKKIYKIIAAYIALSLFTEMIFPTAAFALTGGPSQPEVQSFEPIGTSEMVDLFSGDYSYNIPLLDIGGYPVNLSYHSGVTMDSESSWVGLGWNINPGVINRNMRGIPDDFKGDPITKEFKMKANRTFGVSPGIGVELFGSDKIGLNASVGIRYNNYSGLGFEKSITPSFSAGNKAKGTLNLNVGISSSTEDGLSISPGLSFDFKVKNKEKGDLFLGASVGTSFNSRSGVKQLSIGVNADRGNQITEKNAKGETTYKNKRGTKSYSSIGGGLGSSINFGMQTYTPQVSLPMINTSVTFSAKLGSTFFGGDFTGNISGYYSSQRLAYNSDLVPAYGYLNADEGSKLSKVTLDFNREKDGAFSKNTPALPLTNFTYDIYSVSGQGIGGMYRPFRSDIGYVFDSWNSNTSESYTLGLELAVGNAVHNGIDFAIADVTTSSGKWTDDNDAAGKLVFRPKGHDSLLYEPYYFKQAGEMSVDPDPDLFASLGEYDPVRVNLKYTGGMIVRGDKKFVRKNSTQSEVEELMGTDNYRTKRQKRNQAVTLLTKAEIKKFGLTGDTSIHAKNHHIAEITALRPDGARYVYGMAAYNHRQEETSFSMGNAETDNHSFPTADCNTGLIGYTPAKDNALANEKGVDNYYNNVIMPSYAHSYLLTAVLSPEYVDIDNVRGPSSGDLGSYTRFYYKKDDTYKWRVPVEANKANYNEGLKTDGSDDQGNYLYGEKEMLYLDSIVTKNYIAVFTKEDRKDGYGVLGKDGGINTSSPSKLLRKISLYTKPDHDKYGSNAVPIKEVHFEYNYSLCPLVPNNSGVAEMVNGVDINENEGKLTLKKVYFTYGKSQKGKLSPYTFYYREDQSLYNPGYNLKGYDRWGNYKPNDASSSCAYVLSDPVAAYDFPYVVQNKTLADRYTSAWSLTKINLPSGGVINVEYESDDYAYVQDKQAMQMFTITGIGDDPSDPVSHENAAGHDLLYDGSSLYTYLFFRLQDQISDDVSVEKIKSKYMDGTGVAYFRFLVNVNGQGSEYVTGYAQLDDPSSFGVRDSSGSGNYSHGWIKLKTVPRGNKETGNQENPISKAAWQFARLHTPWVYGFSTPDPTLDIESTIRKMADASLIKGIIQTFQGPNGAIRALGYGKTVDKKRSYIRLLNPNKKKLGGGSRVKQVTISDEWANMQAGANTTSFSYGQVYSYTTTDAYGNTYSSGVAAYEPMLGGDENPFRKPIKFSDNAKWFENLLAPHNDNYIEEPLGESFFPSASVGYSKVTVKNLQYQNVKRNATGYVVHDFYTAKEYPTIVNRTGLDIKPKKTNPIFRLFKISTKDYMNASQGFVVELNDMHGKPKGQSVYPEDSSTPISSVEYKYKQNGNKLANEVLVISKNGSIDTRTVGVDYDVVADMRQQQTEMVSTGMNMNLSSFLAAIFPVIVPIPLPSFQSEYTRFRSAAVTKVIQRYGILEQTVATDLGSIVSTINKAYDAETGEVLLTQTKNDFEDEIYSFTYPAHWAYDLMGPAYKNIGISMLVNISGAGVGTLPGSATSGYRYFAPGDEVSVNNLYKAWVSAVSATTITLIDEDGAPFSTLTGSRTIKVLRSARRNQQSTPVGTFTSFRNPLDMNKDGITDTQLGLVDGTLGILNASAVEFSDKWKTFCECLAPEQGEGDAAIGNPYILNTKGSWKAKRSFLYLTERLQSNLNNNTHIRKDGGFKMFNPFWLANSGNDWVKDLNNWTFTSEVTEFSPYGFELENKDALNRFSAATYGYNNSLPTAVASNSMYKETAFDNFEDYDFGTCTTDHFSFKPFSSYIDTTLSHTGRRSIKVGYNSSIHITKNIESCNEE